MPPPTKAVTLSEDVAAMLDWATRAGGRYIGAALVWVTPARVGARAAIAD